MYNCVCVRVRVCVYVCVYVCVFVCVCVCVCDSLQLDNSSIHSIDQSRPGRGRNHGASYMV